jgi:hypothetical protein
VTRCVHSSPALDRVLNDVPARTVLYDRQADRLLAFGGAEAVVLDPDTLAIEHAFTFGTSQDTSGGLPITGVTLHLDQGEVLGDGRVWMADNLGQIVSLDYRGSGVPDASTLVEVLYLDVGLDDIIPSTTFTAGCEGSPTLAELEPAPGTVLPTGSTVVVSGRVNPVGPTRSVGEVIVGGVPAILDVDGRFFAALPVTDGVRTVSVSAVERCGTFPVGSTSFEGRADGGLGADGFVDVSAMVEADYASSTWALDARSLAFDLAAVNSSTHRLAGPIRAVLDEVAADGVALRQPDGTTADGRPFWLVVPSGSALEGGATSTVRRAALDAIEAPRGFDGGESTGDQHGICSRVRQGVGLPEHPAQDHRCVDVRDHDRSARSARRVATTSMSSAPGTGPGQGKSASDPRAGSTTRSSPGWSSGTTRAIGVDRSMTRISSPSRTARRCSDRWALRSAVPTRFMT